jgi:hypothetical protein
MINIDLKLRRAKQGDSSIFTCYLGCAKQETFD